MNDITITILFGTGMFLAGFILSYVFRFIFKRKTKYDLTQIHNIIYGSAVRQKEAYEGIKELDKIFKELINAKR